MSDGFGFQISHFCEFLRVFENVLFPLGSDKAAECFNVAPSRRGLVCRTPKPEHKLWVKKSRIRVGVFKFCCDANAERDV